VYEGRTPEPLGIGQSEVLVEGADVCIIAVGPTVYPAIEAAELLRAEGIDACVMDPRFVKPVDEKAILDAAGQCGRLVIVEENAVLGGFGSSVLEFLAAHSVTVAVKQIGIPDCFLEHGATETLREAVGISPQGIAEAARSLRIGSYR
jgi:1-deoxy-D-xylulose-5-phosphate synthase